MFGYQLPCSENIQFVGQYMMVTTEQRDGLVFERAYFRSGVCVIPVVDYRESVVRFLRERLWHSLDYVAVKPCTGYLEGNETPMECARRELQEELGLTAGWLLEFSATEETGTINKQQHYFLAYGLTPVEGSPEECEDIVGHTDLSLMEVREMALRGEFGEERLNYALLKLAIEGLPLPPA